MSDWRVRRRVCAFREAFLVARCVESLLRSGARRDEVVVLTPYQAQQRLIQKLLHPEEVRLRSARGPLEPRKLLRFDASSRKALFAWKRTFFCRRERRPSRRVCASCRR